MGHLWKRYRSRYPRCKPWDVPTEEIIQAWDGPYGVALSSDGIFLCIANRGSGNGRVGIIGIAETDSTFINDYGDIRLTDEDGANKPTSLGKFVATFSDPSEPQDLLQRPKPLVNRASSGRTICHF